MTPSESASLIGLPVEVFQAVTAYLSGCPYRDVAQLIRDIEVGAKAVCIPAVPADAGEGV